jgi:hypothetical protein
MRRLGIWPQLAAVVALGVLNGGCILIPEIKDRIVELALTGDTVVEFHATGSSGVIDELKTINLRDSVDLVKILDDAGVDVNDVTNIALSGVAYRVSVADANPSKQIAGGSVTIARGGGSAQPLVTSFTAGAGAVSNFTTAPLDAAGVTIINALLTDWLTEVQGGAPAVTTITYHATGTTTPAPSTDFYWQLKITLAVTGKVKVSVPD